MTARKLMNSQFFIEFYARLPVLVSSHPKRTMRKRTINPKSTMFSFPPCIVFLSSKGRDLYEALLFGLSSSIFYCALRSVYQH